MAESSVIFDVKEPLIHSMVTATAAFWNELPVLVDFWADWCGPCHVLAPHLCRAVEGCGGAIELAKLEVDEGENMRLAGRYLVRGFPTVIMFCQGEEVSRFSSAKPTPWIEHCIEEHASDYLINA